MRTTANGHALLQLDPDADPQAEQAAAAAAAAAFYDPQMFASPYYRFPGTALYRPAIFRAADEGEDSSEWEMRHGFENQLNSHEYADLLSSNFFMYFTDKRHETGGKPKPRLVPLTEWRLRDKHKTSQAVLFLCLNIGVDPPDVVKTNPCPRLECWIDTTRLHGTASQPPMGQIGKNLQQQYEQLSVRTQYRVCPDPTVDEIGKYHAHLRRSLPVRERERLLFHYNGHGVPRPTSSGELWFFNKNYTQYIPIPLYDILTRLGAPTLFVFDCSDAGVLIDHFVRFAQEHPNEAAQVPAYGSCLLLAACRAGETLPMNPDLPADLFTSCLTSPIEMAIRHFLLQSPLPGNVGIDEVGPIPGKVSERKSPLGELNWIFTAITDTIAWNMLDTTLFKRLFRQDLMIAALFRNFLLAQRVMRKYGVHPVSYPPIPDTHEHPLWESWDLAVDLALGQLPKLKEAQAKAAAQNSVRGQLLPHTGTSTAAVANPGGVVNVANFNNNHNNTAAALANNNHHNNIASTITASNATNSTIAGPSAPSNGVVQPNGLSKPVDYQYQNSSFFSDQLTAFEVYLSQGALDEQVPQQLPVVMQVLLSQSHRLRALILLSKFLDLGPWAVNHALSIGIHPYVLKLLQSQALELKPVMVYIWSRILAMDRTCQYDLLKDNAWRYFSHILIVPDVDIPLANLYEHRAMCAFVLATFCYNNPAAKRVCLSVELMDSLLRYTVYPENALLRQWACLCLASMWTFNPEGQWIGIRACAHQRISELVCDPVVEVRAAAVSAMAALLYLPDNGIGGRGPNSLHHVVQVEEALGSAVLILGNDGSALVRREVVRFWAIWTGRFGGRLTVAAYQSMVDEAERNDEDDSGLAANGKGSWSGRKSVSSIPPPSPHSAETELSQMTAGTMYPAVWKQLLILSTDSVLDVAEGACMIVDHIMDRLLKSGLGSLDVMRRMVDQIVADTSVPRPRDSVSEKGADGGAYTNGPPASLGLGHGRSHTHTHVPTVNGITGSDSPKSAQAAIPTGLARAESYLALGIRRTASVAASLKQFAFGGLTSPTKPRARQVDQAPSIAPATTITPRRPQPKRAVTWARESRTDYDHSDGLNNQPSAGDRRTHSDGGGGDEAADKPAPGSEPVFPLPPPTPFFDWCTEYFREPQMKPADADEPGSADYNDRLWRRNRNDKIIAKTQPLKTWAATTRWEKNKSLLSNPAQPKILCFHQFEDELVVADRASGITVWDWRKGTRLSNFSNLNPAGSDVTSVTLINEDDQSLLMTGASDGTVRIFKDYYTTEPTLIAGFRALADMMPADRSGGLILDWQQSSGHLLVAGDVRLIRVWNAGTETCVADIPARSGSAITGLTSDQVEGQVFAAGFADGAVRVYDRRIRSSDAMVRAWREHRDGVVGIHLQRGGRRELVSGSRDGVVRLWDIRMDRSVAAVQAVERGLSSLAVHEHAPVFAVGSSKRQVLFYNMQTIGTVAAAAAAAAVTAAATAAAPGGGMTSPTMGSAGLGPVQPSSASVSSLTSPVAKAATLYPVHHAHPSTMGLIPTPLSTAFAGPSILSPTREYHGHQHFPGLTAGAGASGGDTVKNLSLLSLSGTATQPGGASTTSLPLPGFSHSNAQHHHHHHHPQPHHHHHHQQHHHQHHSHSPPGSTSSSAPTGLFSAFVPSSSFLGLRVPPVPIAATAFHPHQMLIAAAAEGDMHVSVVGCGSKRGGEDDF